MGTITDTAADTFRDFVTTGLPASGAHEPVKAEIRDLFAAIEATMGTLSLGSVSVTKTTKALLDADLAHAANTVALVYADATDANNDLYVKVGASGTGSWTLTSILHDVLSGLAQPYVDAAEASADTAQAAAISTANAVAASYGVVLGSGGGALYDLRFWETMLFQDSAATIPVTASGDPVGCVRNVFGDTNWDLIQATSGKRPTFRIREGIPCIEAAAGTGLYARANHNMPIPCYLAAALRMESSDVNSVFGFIKNDGSKYFIAADTLGRARGSISAVTPARAWTIPTTPPYTVPLSTIAVFDSLAVAGEVDCRINGHPEDPAYSPKATTWVDGDVVTSMSFGFNVSTESGDIGQVDTGKSATFFGGLVLFGIPEDRDAVVAMMRGWIEPEIRDTDEVVMVIGDSTSDGVITATGQLGNELVEKLASDKIAVANPTSTVIFRRYARIGDHPCGWRLVQEGTDGHRKFVFNFSVSGSRPSHFMAERFDDWIAPIPHVDRIIFNHGHNMAVTTTDATGMLRRGEYMDAIDKLKRAFPEAKWLALRVHPVRTTNAMLPVVTAFDAVENLYGDITVADVYTHFDSAARPVAWYDADGVHLSDPTGIAEQYGVVAAVYDSMAAPTSAAALGRTSSLIITNGLFDDFDGAVPDGWTKTGAGTVSRSTEQVDTELGDNYSVKLSGVVSLDQTFNVTAYQGSTIVFAARLYLEAGGSATTGRIQGTTNGTGAVSSTDWLYDTNDQPVDGWRWGYFHLPIPADATTATLKIHGTASGTGTAYFGRVTSVEGLRPKDKR